MPLYHSLLDALCVGIMATGLPRITDKRQVISAVRQDARQFVETGAGRLRGKTVVWLHGASIGEMKCLWPVARALIGRNLCEVILASYTSPDALCEIRQEWCISHHQLVTLPLPDVWLGTIATAMNLCSLILFVEAEGGEDRKIASLLQEHKVPKLLIDGRFRHDSSLLRKHLHDKKYRRWAEIFDLVCVGSQEEYSVASAFVPPDRLVLTGPSKAIISAEASACACEARTQLRTSMSLENREPVIVIGSIIWDEFARVADLCRWAEKHYGRAVMIVAPRYVRSRRHIPALRRLFHDRQIMYGLLSSETKNNKSVGQQGTIRTWIVDEVGRLPTLYAVATVSVVGGTLFRGQGHNLLEPIAMGSPVICGPSLGNWLGMSRSLIRNDAICITSPATLEDAIESLVAKPERAAVLCRNACSALADMSRRGLRNVEIALQLATRATRR